MIERSLSEARPLVGELVFAESPRWRGDRLWFSDMHGESVHTVDESGYHQIILTLPGVRPSGLGFLPDDSVLIVSMLERQLLRWDGETLGVYADLTSVEPNGCNDMVVSETGFAYVGAFPPTGSPSAAIHSVSPRGEVRTVATDVVFPNGSVITPDGGFLIVAESLGRRFSRFKIASDGSLGVRDEFAGCPGFGPDGICLDEDGAIWAAMPLARQFQRIEPGGRVTHVIDASDRMAIACTLGGVDRRELFLLTAMDHSPDALKGSRDSRIDVLRVDVPGAGLP